MGLHLPHLHRLRHLQMETKTFELHGSVVTLERKRNTRNEVAAGTVDGDADFVQQISDGAMHWQPESMNHRAARILK